MKLLHLALGLVALSSCSKATPEPPRATPATKERVISVDAQLIGTGRLTTTKAELRPVAGFIVATGQIEAPPDGAAAITSPVTARVREISVRRGDSVKKGQHLATLDAGEVARIVSDLGRARARRIHAERVLAQEEKLLETKATSERAVSDAKSGVDAAKADEKAAQTLLANYGAARGSQLVMTSPIDGVVVRVDGVVGAPVEATSPLLRIVNTERLNVRADVAESDADQVASGAHASVQSSSKGPTCSGTIETHAPEVDPRTRTVPFRVVLGKDCGSFHEGGFVDVSIERKTTGDRKLVAVPRNAVVSIDDVPVVFVPTDKPNEFKPKTVRVAEYAGPVVFLEDGVHEGDTLVENGALLLKGELMRSRLE